MSIKFKSASDFRKSLENRLQNLAGKTGYDLQRVRRTVAFDRLLARLLMPDNTPFVLKGGYAMELRLSNARATKDMDLTFLQKKNKGEALIKDIIAEELKKLALRDLSDFFVYQIGQVQIDLENAPYGGARYPVSSFIDGKLFVRFQLDVGGDSLISQTEIVQGRDWLSFCDIPPPVFKMISLEQQFAEKLHAYSLLRENRKNTRVKDLIDMILLANMRLIDFALLKNTVQKVFEIRNTHLLPAVLEAPPTEWQRPYMELANECKLHFSLDESFSQLTNIYKTMLSS